MTKHLGTLKGEGYLTVGKQEPVAAGYRLDVFQRGQMRYGVGEVHASFEVISDAMLSAQHALLQLENGGEVQIHVTHWDGSSGTAKFETSGRVPGF